MIVVTVVVMVTVVQAAVVWLGQGADMRSESMLLQQQRRLLQQPFYEVFMSSSRMLVLTPCGVGGFSKSIATSHLRGCAPLSITGTLCNAPYLQMLLQLVHQVFPF